MKKKQENFIKYLRDTNFLKEIFDIITINEGKNIIDRITLIIKEKEIREEKEAIKKEKIKRILHQLNIEGFTINDLKNTKNK